MLAVRVDVLADHGAFNAAAQPTKLPGRVLQRLHRLLRPRGRPLPRARRLHEQGARAASPTRARSGSPRPSTWSSGWSTASPRELELDPAQLRLAEPDRPRPVPVPRARPAGCTTPATTRGRCARRWRSPATTSCAASRRATRERGELMGIGLVVLHRGGRRRAAQAHGHPRARDERRRRRCGSTRPARRSSRSACRPRARATRRRSPRSSPQELGIPPEDVEVVHGDTDTTPYGLGTYGSRSTPVSGAATALVARKVRDRARLVAAAMLEVAPEDLEWENARPAPARWFVKGDPRAGRDDPGDRAGRARLGRAAATGSRPGSTPRPSTTRRT